MPKRSAHTSWTGDLQDGLGRVTLSSSGVGAYDISFPRRTADDAEGTTSPEELIAAAHASCYAMQLSALIAAEGGTPVGLEVDAIVSLAPDPEGGFRIPIIELVVRGTVHSMDDSTFKAVAADAKTKCPVSKALAGTTITLDATLA